MSSTAFSHLFPSAAVAAVSLLPRRVSLQLFCASSGDAHGLRRRSRRMAVVRAATAEAAAPAYTSDSLILYFKAEGTMEERAIPKIIESLEGMEGVKDLEVLIEEGIASVVLTKETTVQATGVASNLVEAIQGAGFKLQTLSLSFDDFDDATARAGGNVQPSEFIDLLHEAPLSGHREPRSIVGGTLYCILLVGFAAVAISAPWIFLFAPDMISPLLCSSNAILLVLTGIFQQYWVHQVRKVRLQGYYDFSQKLKRIARLPFATIACGTALMLLIMVWQPLVQILSVSLLLRIAIVVEVTCAGCFMGLYIWHIHKYNSLDGQPDILRSLYSALQPSSTFEDRRYHDARLSDQQMALLQYQRENIHYLSEEVLRLQECLSKYQRTDAGTTPQVDLAHLLATRDQELRALTAEMNQVHSELQLARGLIDEKESEIQRIRLSNSQYVEENDRLRAILGEWSARAAKLERALEAERASNIELRKNIAKFRGHLYKEQEA